MNTNTRLLSLIIATLTLFGLTSGAYAQSATCGITGNATASAASYDPFNPTGLGSTAVQLSLRRVNGAGGQKTNVVNFYLKGQNAAADGIMIVPTSVVVDGNFSGTGLNIFYNFAQAAPILAPTSQTPSGSNRFLKIEFTGNNAASDFATVIFNVTLPANLNLNASATLPFDAIFACSTSGGGPATQQTGSISNAISFPITVLSALQASYVGTALDFGDVGDVAAGQTTGPTSINNHVRVRSSGPYSLMLTSQNGYKLTFSGGNLAEPLQTLNYSARFAGQTRSAASPTFATVTCLRAGVPAAEADILPLQATLLEGGQGKMAAANYSDILTITVTPLVTSAPSQFSCPAL
ncbi:MAG: hypothetical protein AABY88_12250 [Pseudomonadota bacterium]